MLQLSQKVVYSLFPSRGWCRCILDRDNALLRQRDGFRAYQYNRSMRNVTVRLQRALKVVSTALDAGRFPLPSFSFGFCETHGTGEGSN